MHKNGVPVTEFSGLTLYITTLLNKNDTKLKMRDASVKVFQGERAERRQRNGRTEGLVLFFAIKYIQSADGFSYEHHRWME